MRGLAILLACLLLAACQAGSRRGDEGAPAVFDLGPAALHEPAARTFPMGLEVRLVPWLDASGISYRLRYSEPARVREYARARWAASPAVMIQSRLARELDLLAVGQGRAACLLRVEIDEFAQWFASPDESSAVLRGRALWLDGARNVLAEMPLAFDTRAPSADSSGAVLALGLSVDQLGAALGRRERELFAAGKLAACRR